MNGNHATANAEKVLIEESKAAPAPAFDDGLPPPTYAQIECWRKLYRALSHAKSRAMTDEAWPADLAPTKPTLKALVERGVIVRRGRAWHLKRDWCRRICALRERAGAESGGRQAEWSRGRLEPACDVGRRLDDVERPGRAARAMRHFRHADVLLSC